MSADASFSTANLQCFAARLADMRSFASVDANVDGQSGSLDESLAAVTKLAGERTFLTVNSSVSVALTGGMKPKR